MLTTPEADAGASETMPPIRTVAAVIANAAGEVLLVRKRGTGVFIQPGGKREPDEAPLATLARELIEELGVQLDVGSAVFLGEFEDAAVNEAGRAVRALAYRCRVHGQPLPLAEIEEIAWVEPAQPPRIRIAPLSARHILPAYLAAAASTPAEST